MLKLILVKTQGTSRHIKAHQGTHRTIHRPQPRLQIGLFDNPETLVRDLEMYSGKDTNTRQTVLKGCGL